MKAKRRRHDPEFKARVALEAIRGIKTVQQIGKEFDVHPVQVSEWKKAMLEGAAGVFGAVRRGRFRERAQRAALNSNLLVATKTYPDSTGGSDVVTYTYNRAGQVTTMKDQAGLVHTYTFDTLGRQTQDEVTAWGASSVDQTIKKLTTDYNDRGLVVSAMSRDSTNAVRNAVYFDYNGWRQLATEAQVQNLPGSGGVTRIVQYSYETGASGSNTVRRTGMTYPSGAALQYHYSSTGTSHGNALSRVSTIRDGSTDIISYAWLGLGTPVDVNYNVPATHLSLGTSADHYAGLDRFGRPITEVDPEIRARS